MSVFVLWGFYRWMSPSTFQLFVLRRGADPSRHPPRHTIPTPRSSPRGVRGVRMWLGHEWAERFLGSNRPLLASASQAKRPKLEVLGTRKSNIYVHGERMATPRFTKKAKRRSLVGPGPAGPRKRRRLDDRPAAEPPRRRPAYPGMRRSVIDFFSFFPGLI